MTDKQFSTLFADALSTPDRESFVSDWALSSIWGEDPDQLPDLSKLSAECGKVWDLAHMAIKDIRRATGLSQAAFGLRYLIPRRTIEDWEAGRHSCPDYVRVLLARACGLAKL